MKTSATLPVVYAYPYTNWDMPPARQRYLMTALSQYTEVYYLDRPPGATRYRFGLPYAEPVSPSLTIIRNAFGLRYSRLRQYSERAAVALDAVHLHTLLRQRGVAKYIYWVGAPDPLLLQGMQCEHLVYDCIDPCFIPSEQEQFDRNELAIARAAKIVFCTAETLLVRCGAVNTASHLLPNACSPDEYPPERNPSLPLPAPLQNRGDRPVIGFMGTMDWRMDVETLAYAAQCLPEYTFALAGRVNYDQEERLRVLRALPNVVVLGTVSLGEGRAYTAAFTVGLILFVPGPMCDAVNPVKMYMYLAAGKPVVTTDLRETRTPGEPLVYATRTPDEFVAAIRRAVAEASDTSLREARVAFARQNTWDERARVAAYHLACQFPAPDAVAARRIPHPISLVAAGQNHHNSDNESGGFSPRAGNQQ